MNLTERFFTKTAAYRAVKADREGQTLSHAYLLVCADETWLRSYVKALCRAILCEKGDLCGECRPCRLIDKENFADCEFYPTEGEKITAEGINEITTEKCYVKPLESEVKIFAIVGAEKMNLTAQNKLLKTLEEPPKNVVIVLGALTDSPLLPTVKSRVKKLQIPAFSTEEIIELLSPRFADKGRLRAAAELCDGRPGEVEGAYNDDAKLMAASECVNIFLKMKKSKDIAYYSGILAKKTREEFAAFLSAMSLVVRDILYVKHSLSGSLINVDLADKIEEIADRYKEGALLKIAEIIEQYIAAASNYANQTMLADGLLFAMLEENYRWQKL